MSTLETSATPAPMSTALTLLYALPLGVLAATAARLPAASPAIVILGGAGLGLCALGLNRPGLAAVLSLAALLVAAGAVRVLTSAASRGVLTGPARFDGTVAQIDHGGLVVDVDDVALNDGTAGPLTLLVSARPSGAARIVPGDRVEVEAPGLRPPGQRPGPRSVAALERLGVDAVVAGAQVTRLGVGSVPVRVLGELRASLAGIIDRSLPAPTAAILAGIAFGWHAPIDPATRADLQDAGLIHVVAVSGLKVVIVAGLLRALLLRTPLRHRWRSAALIAGIAAYAILSGGGPAAARSGLTAVVGLVLGGDGRRVRPFAVLGLCATGMLAVSPRLLGDVGFQLSFLGTAGILLLADPLSRRLPGPRLLAEPFAVTVAAQLATVPVMVGTFHTLSLVGPLANALVLPLLPALIVLGWAGPAVAVAFAPAGMALLGIAGLGVDAAVVVAHIAGRMPLAAIHIASWPLAWTLAEVVALAAGLAFWQISCRAAASRDGL